MARARTTRVNPKVPLALSSLVMRCIANNPSERPDSMSQVYERLELAIAQLVREGNSSDDSGGMSPPRAAVL